MSSVSRVIADDGVHYEHFVISSADADIRPDGELRVRLLRPLQRVRALRLVYAELPKTTRVLDLMLDVGTQAGRLVSQQVARSAKSNENDTQQRQAFGRIFVQDYETGDFLDNAAKVAFSTGTVSRFLYENDNKNYMRFEFRPSLSSLSLLNVKLFSTLLDQNNQTLPYSPDLNIVSFGQAFIDQGIPFGPLPDSYMYPANVAPQTIAFITQPSNTYIENATEAQTRAYIANLTDVFTVADYEAVVTTVEGTGVTGYNALFGVPSTFDHTGDVITPIGAQLTALTVNRAPYVRLRLQDSSLPQIDESGNATTPLRYSLLTSSKPFDDFLFNENTTPLGTVYPYSWLSMDDAIDQTNKPAFPYAFTSALEIYKPSSPSDAQMELNLEASFRRRCIVHLSPEIRQLLGPIPSMAMREALNWSEEDQLHRTYYTLDGYELSHLYPDTYRDPNYDIYLRFYRCMLKFFLRKMSVRSQMQTRPIHGVLSSVMNARLANFYKVTEVLPLSYSFLNYFLSVTGLPASETPFIFAIEFDRNYRPESDISAIAPTPMHLVPLEASFVLDGGHGVTAPLSMDSFLRSSFPVTLTFEAEIEQR